MPRRCGYSVGIFLLFASYFALALDMPFFTRGEGREGLVVQDMFEQHNLILPLRNGADIPSKPPLFHWAGYAFSSAGPGSKPEFFIRLPSALASAAAIAAFFYFFSDRRSPAAALFGVLAFATSLDWLRHSVIARVDMMLDIWSALGTRALVESVEAGKKNESRPWGMYTLAAVALGLAALTKGPAGIAIPGAVAALYAFMSLPVKRLPFFPALYTLLLAAGIASLWYLAAYHQGGAEFLNVHLMRENVARVVGMKNYEVGHESGAYSIVPMIISGLLPWSFLIPAGLFALWTKRGKLFAEDPALKFAVIWAGFYLVFFSLTASKRNVYLLPSLPAYGYMLAAAVDSHELGGARGIRLSGWLFAAFGAVLAAGLAVLVDLHWFDVGPLLARFKVKPHDIDTVKDFSSLSPLVLAGIGASALLLFTGAAAFLRRRPERGLARVAAAQLIFAASVNLGIMPVIAEKQTPKNELGAFTAAIPEGAPLFQFRQDFYAVDYYIGRPVPTVKTKPELTNSAFGYIFVAESDLNEAGEVFPGAEEIVKSSAPILYGKTRLVLLKFS